MVKKLKGTPLALSPEKVEAILSGEKVHTIRALSDLDYRRWEEDSEDGPAYWSQEDQEWYLILGPYGHPDRSYMWVREAYREVDGSIEYRSVIDPDKKTPNSKWERVVGMPERCSRLKLLVTACRFSRGVQDLSIQDMMRDGFSSDKEGKAAVAHIRDQYRKYWNKRNRGPMQKWKSNPSVWITEFSIMECKD